MLSLLSAQFCYKTKASLKKYWLNEEKLMVKNSNNDNNEGYKYMTKAEILCLYKILFSPLVKYLFQRNTADLY